ncbi:MAG: hypothetical protein RSC64_08415 [Hydrogenoanaerobacterium sp.]
MSFKISLIDDAPIWDSLPVAKIVTYPLEKRDYKPFAQARICISKKSIWVRLWAFEALPSETSSLSVCLNLFPEISDKFIMLSVNHKGVMHCETGMGNSRSPLSELMVLPRLKLFNSEDLQGIYWGVVFELPRTALTKLYGTDELTAGKIIKGNFYKTDTGECSEHYGCFYNVDFCDNNPYGSRFFGDFELVEY